MKIVEMYLRNDWIIENTTRQRFKKMNVEDYISSSLKLLKAAPILGFAGVGMSNGMHEESRVLFNAHTHILKEMHNGIGNAGKNNCRFIEPIDRLNEARMHNEVSGDLNLPYSRVWVVTDDECAEQDHMEKGVIFHSKTEAQKFATMYNNLEEFTESKFYKPSDVASIEIKESDYEIFEEELAIFLQQRKHWLFDEIILRDDIDETDFKISYLYEEDPDDLLVQDNSRIIEIEFPAAVSKEEYAKYFIKTNEAKEQLLAEAISTMEEGDYTPVDEEEVREKIDEEIHEETVTEEVVDEDLIVNVETAAILKEEEVAEKVEEKVIPKPVNTFLSVKSMGTLGFFKAYEEEPFSSEEINGVKLG